MINSPELSLDMNLDSPSADADGCGGHGGGGMNENDNNIIHRGTRHNDNQQHEHDSRYYNISSSGIREDNNYSFNDGNTNNGGNGGGGGGGGGGGAKKIDCDKMTKSMEEWKDELSMMRVKNAILLDDLVKVGAINVV